MIGRDGFGKSWMRKVNSYWLLISDNRTTEDFIKLFMKAKRKTTQRPEEICVDGSYSHIKGFKKSFLE